MERKVSIKDLIASLVEEVATGGTIKMEVDGHSILVTLQERGGKVFISFAPSDEKSAKGFLAGLATIRQDDGTYRLYADDVPDS